mgnify:CR=1 FL=1
MINATTSSYPATLNARANINVQGRVGNISTGDAILENPTIPELIFTVGEPYAASLSSTAFTTQQMWRGVSLSQPPSGGETLMHHVRASPPPSNDFFALRLCRVSFELPT